MPISGRVAYIVRERSIDDEINGPGWEVDLG
jgi:hypothetical protein